MKEIKTSGLHIGDNAAEKIGNVICEMIEKVQQDWKKPWVSTEMEAPMSLGAKRPYNGMNSFLLSMLVGVAGYKTPYFLTMTNIKALGLKLNKCKVKDKKTGEEKEGYELPFPVMFWTVGYTNGEKKYITREEWLELSSSERNDWHEFWVLKVYNVWNIDQTDYATVLPEKYAKLLPENKMDGHVHEQDYSNGVLDLEIEGGEWRCPIRQTDEDRAYYSIAEDRISIPRRENFNTASEFYGTALHEMSHSTGKELKRDQSGFFGSPEYAKEELVAELTAAIVLNDLGVEKYLKEDSIPYLKSWSKVLRDTQAVKKVMNEVMKAVSYHKKAYASAEHKLNTKEKVA